MAIVNRTTGGLGVTTSHTVTIPAVGNGNSLLVIISTNSTMAPSAMSDNGGGSPTYSADVSAEQLEGSDQGLIWIFRRNGITTAPTQISFTTAANPAGGGIYDIIEFDNLASATFAEFNKSSSAFATSNTATVTTDTANQIGIGAVGMGSIGNRTLNTTSDGWTGGHPGDSTATRARSFVNPDLGSAGSKSFVGTNSSAQNIVVAMWSYETTAASGPADPEITDVSPDTVSASTAALTITGTTFGASQGTNGLVVISPSSTNPTASGYEAQAIDSWGATEIVTDGVTLPSGTEHNDTLYVYVRNDDEDWSEGYPITAALADPVLRSTVYPLRDTDTGDLIDASGVAWVALSDDLATRVAGGTVNITDGEYEIRNGSLTTLEATYRLVLVEDATRMAIYPASIIDLNEPE